MLLPLKLGSSLLKTEGDSCTLVLQVGTCWLRLGLKSDQTPRVSQWIHDDIEPCLNSVKSGEDLDVCCSRAEWRPVLKAVLANAFGKLGEYPPDKASVVLLESFRLPLSFREALFDVLFAQFRVASVHAAPDIVMPLLLQAQTTGLVLDLGHEETRCVPVAFSVPVFKAAKWAPGRGFKAVFEYFCKLQATAHKDYPNLSTPYQEAALIINKFCYCKFECRNGFKFQLNNPVHRRAVTILEETRWRVMEVLFNDKDRPKQPRVASLPIGELVVEVLKSTDINLWKLVIQNIVITGGMAGIRGMKERVAIEILKALEQDEATKRLDRNLVLMGSMPYNPLISQWLGGTIYAAAESELKIIEKKAWSHSTEVDCTDMWGMFERREDPGFESEYERAMCY